MRNLFRIKFVFAIAVFFAILLSVLVYKFNIYNKLYDKSKPNIFEIPGTAHEYTISEKSYFEYYFMIQKIPNDDTKIRNMIDEYIINSDVVLRSFDKGASCVILNYMIPSTKFPVYFEEDNNYFIMDDFVTHYEKTNRVVCVRFENKNDEGEYIFYKKVLDKL